MMFTTVLLLLLPASLGIGCVFLAVVDVADGLDFLAERFDEIVINGSLFRQQRDQILSLRFLRQRMKDVFFQTTEDERSVWEGERERERERERGGREQMSSVDCEKRQKFGII